MGLLRYQLFLVIGVTFIAIWAGLLKQLETNNNTTNNNNDTTNDKSYYRIQSLLILYAPLWAVLVLGIYAVGSIGYGLMNFKDVPDAADEIDQQIIEAKAEMIQRGIIKEVQTKKNERRNNK